MAEDKKALTKEQILGASDIEIEKVDVSEWGGFVYVKGMTAKQRDDFEASILVILLPNGNSFVTCQPEGTSFEKDP